MSTTNIVAPTGTIDLTQMRYQMMKSLELQQFTENENISLRKQINELNKTLSDTYNTDKGNKLSDAEVMMLQEKYQKLKTSFSQLHSSVSSIRSDYQKFTKTSLADYSNLKIQFNKIIQYLKQVEKEKNDINTNSTKLQKLNDKMILNYKNENLKNIQIIEKLTKESLLWENKVKETSESDSKYQEMKKDYHDLINKNNGLLTKIEVG